MFKADVLLCREFAAMFGRKTLLCLLFRSVLGLCALHLAASAALAQGLSPINQLLADPTEQAHVLAAARRSNAVIDGGCTAAQFTLTPTVMMIQPPTFDASGHILSGAWKQVVQENGCGISRFLNVLAVVSQPGTLRTAPLLPGTTHADPALQKDGATYAYTAGGVVERTCPAEYIADTMFVRYDNVQPSGGGRPSWQEVWTLIACNRKTLVMMHFIPDATGTRIIAGPVQARRLDTP